MSSKACSRPRSPASGVLPLAKAGGQQQPPHTERGRSSSLHAPTTSMAPAAGRQRACQPAEGVLAPQRTAASAHSHLGGTHNTRRTIQVRCRERAKLDRECHRDCDDHNGCCDRYYECSHSLTQKVRAQRPSREGYALHPSPNSFAPRPTSANKLGTQTPVSSWRTTGTPEGPEAPTMTISSSNTKVITILIIITGPKKLLQA